MGEAIAETFDIEFGFVSDEENSLAYVSVERYHTFSVGLLVDPHVKPLLHSQLAAP